MQFAVDRAAVHGRPVLRVRGELDVATAPVLAASVEAALAERPSDLVVDLGPTTFLDSTGCRQLAVSARRAKGEGVDVVVVCPSSNAAVRRVIDFLELGALVDVLEAAPPVR